MKELTLPNYKTLQQALNKTSLKLHPAQVHGLMCGILSGDTTGSTAWEELVTGGKEKTPEVLQELYEASNTQLAEFLFEFQLVLPPDSQDLSSRAEALTLWCQGFLTGLKFIKIEIVNRESSEVTEAINDIIEIAKMNYEVVVASEEDETAYVELVEYIRMAVVLIYQDLHEANASNKASVSSDHLH